MIGAKHIAGVSPIGEGREYHKVFAFTTVEAHTEVSDFFIFADVCQACTIEVPKICSTSKPAASWGMFS